MEYIKLAIAVLVMALLTMASMLFIASHIRQIKSGNNTALLIFMFIGSVLFAVTAIISITEYIVHFEHIQQITLSTMILLMLGLTVVNLGLCILLLGSKYWIFIRLKIYNTVPKCIFSTANIKIAAYIPMVKGDVNVFVFPENSTTAQVVSIAVRGYRIGRISVLLIAKSEPTIYYSPERILFFIDDNDAINRVYYPDNIADYFIALPAHTTIDICGTSWNSNMSLLVYLYGTKSSKNVGYFIANIKGDILLASEYLKAIDPSMSLPESILSEIKSLNEDIGSFVFDSFNISFNYSKDRRLLLCVFLPYAPESHGLTDYLVSITRSIAHEVNNALTALSMYINNAGNEFGMKSVNADKHINNLNYASYLISSALTHVLVFDDNNIIPSIGSYSTQQIVSETLRSYMKRIIDSNDSVVFDIPDFNCRCDIRLVQIMLFSIISDISNYKQKLPIDIRCQQNIDDVIISISIQDKRGDYYERVCRSLVPFFALSNKTTRSLTSALVYKSTTKIVNKMSGSFDFYRGYGKCVVKIILPRAQKGQQKKVIPIEYNTSNPPSILIVDDNIEVAISIKAILTANIRCNISLAYTYKSALSLITDNKFDIVISDINLPDGVGVTLAQAANSNANFIFISGHLGIEELEDISDNYVFLQKPFEYHSLLEHISAIITPPQDHHKICKTS